MHDHHSRKSIQAQLRELCRDSMKIQRPKVNYLVRTILIRSNRFHLCVFIFFFVIQWKSFYAKEPIVKMETFGHVTLAIGNGFVCLECGDDFQESNHIGSLTKCFRCKYQTVCSRAILEHVSSCIDADDEAKALPPSPLGQKMFCICGFSSDDGNELANHLAQCDKKSAYDTSDAALENTVKCNMLDMLGLMPRDGEEDDDSSDNLLIPADQQQQLLSKSIDGAGKAPAADDDEDLSKTQPPQAIDDFNTQLSLDDLAPPSVAPQNEQDDRTPTLSDEYQVNFTHQSHQSDPPISFGFFFFQSLATPRVASYPPQYDSNEFEMQTNN